MVHVIVGHGSPDRGADQRCSPTQDKIDLVVCVCVGQKHIDHQDVVKMKALQKSLLKVCQTRLVSVRSKVVGKSNKRNQQPLGGNETNKRERK